MLFEKSKGQIRLSEDAFNKLKQLIHNYSGIIFKDVKSVESLEYRLENRLKINNCSSFEEYLDIFRDKTKAQKEIQKMFDAVSIWDTSFFRYQNQFQAFIDDLLPVIIENGNRKDQKTLRIWSVGCSTGEEPYSIALMLDQFMENELKDWQILITATDLSEEALLHARKAFYGENSLRKVSQSWRDKYFSKMDSGHYELNEDIRSRITFGKINLKNKNMVNTMSNLDAIFCRNVFSYFDEEQIQLLTQQFYNSLKHGGYLFLGQAETLHNITHEFQMISRNRALSYYKE